MSLIGVISSLSTPGPYTITRTAPGGFVKGRYTEGAQTTFTITGSIQPVGGRELEDLPEGQSGTEVRVIYTTTELFTRTPANESDYVTLDGEDWYVYRVERWQAFGGTHWVAYVSRLTSP